MTGALVTGPSVGFGFLGAGNIARTALGPAVHAADRLLVEAWWYRWHPRTLRAIELIGAGAIGRVARVESEFSFDADLTGNFRLDAGRGGGALYDVGCYAVDAARWALGAGAWTWSRPRVTCGAGWTCAPRRAWPGPTARSPTSAAGSRAPRSSW